LKPLSLDDIKCFSSIFAAIDSAGAYSSLKERAIDITKKMLKIKNVNVILFALEDNESLNRDTDPINMFSMDTMQSCKSNGLKESFVYSNKGDTYLSVPIVVDKKVTGAITISHDCSNGQNQIFSKNDKLLLEVIGHNIGIAAQKAILLQLQTLERKKNAALLSIVRARSADESLEAVWKTAIDAIYSMFHPDVLSIFLCDHSNNEVFIVASRNQMEGLTLPFSNTVASTVAENGKAIRLRVAEEENYFMWADDYTGFKTNTVLCVPVPGFHLNARPIAVLEVINKSNGKYFLSQDEDALREICAEISLVLRRKAMELHELKYRAKRGNLDPHCLDTLELEKSILGEYGAVMNKFQAKRLSAPTLSDSELSSKGNISPSKSRQRKRSSVTGIQSILHDIKFAASSNVMSELILSHDTDPFELDEAVKMELFIEMLDSYRLFDIFNLDKNNMRSFVSKVWRKYHSENDFHNFTHAWGVAHLCFVILRKGGVDVLLKPLEILTLLLSAICHDIDHPGHNNAFEVATRSELAILYADDAVLERHHISVTVRLIEECATTTFGGLTTEQLTEFRTKMTSAVLQTDMSQHFKVLDDILRRTQLSSPYSRSESDSSRILLGHILHAADIGAQTQSQTVAMKWTDALTREFSSQAKKELDLGLPVTSMMHGLDDELKKMQLQASFVKGIVMPLWSALSTCFPDLAYAVQQAESNQKFYLLQVDRLIAERNDNVVSI
jgi:3',5'-cyclic-nucleotide phosphodiesterase